MMEGKMKFGIKVDKLPKYCWSVGACISHGTPETYLFINLFKWSISIGYMYFYSEEASV